MRHLFVCFVCYCWSLSVSAQHLTAYQYLDSARLEYSQDHNLRSVHLLRDFLKHYPQHALAEEVQVALGTLYQDQKDFQQAIPVFNGALSWAPQAQERENYHEGEKYVPRPIPNEGEPDWFIPVLRVRSTLQRDLQYEAMYALYEIYLDKQQFDSCLYYLKIARNFTPSHGCGNEYINGLQVLSRREAQVHLLQRDTMKAINALFFSAIHSGMDVYRPAITLLTDLLNAKYTPDEIASEIKGAIADASLIANEDGRLVPKFVVFGLPVQVYLGGVKEDDELRKYLLANPHLKKLCGVE